jgi:16S rRNA (guanine966-N2)-methyltransferase
MPPKSKPGELRIIAGQWRRRKIPVLDQPGLRPTPDRVRETVFNWLQNQVIGAHCLDLFAGSGALGLEALSRGAAHVTFVDNNLHAIKQIRQILTQFDAHNATVLHADVRRSLATPKQPYDIVFLDPPFELNYIPAMCEQLMQPGWLAPQALLYVECETTCADLILPDSWRILHDKTAGQVRYRLVVCSN